MSGLVIAELGGWRIEADPEVNREHYLRVEAWECPCDHCVNWRALGESALPPAIVEFLGIIGADVGKPTEVFELGRRTDGRHLMSGWYQFSARILSEQPRKRSRGVVEALPTRLDDGFLCGFFYYLTGPGSALEPPEPHATFEFGWAVPWLGTEPPGCSGEEPIE